RHQRSCHPDQVDNSSEARARSAASAYNRRFPDSRQIYAGHRARVMQLISELPRGDAICVLGAGNGSDLELAALAQQYEQIHLVDLDGEALERVRAQQPPPVRDRLVLHEDVDLSGLLEHLDDWGERFPEPAELATSAVAAARGLIRQLGRSFAATVSTCVLSQLALPFQRSWVTSGPNWANLLSTLTAVHLATLAGSTRSGGHGLLVFDTSSSRDTPELMSQREQSGIELQSFVDRGQAEGWLALRPAPTDLLQQLASPGLGALVADTELGLPWLWELGDATQLVYSLRFRHP
ncbi:MAG TPA: hypothetical protein VNW92_32010, partial [Polyangiaceae bacterium]|nr:hypothetical protein [Polyangiaceae bacterium]